LTISIEKKQYKKRTKTIPFLLFAVPRNDFANAAKINIRTGREIDFFCLT
jgi:hypothetical protein